MTLYASNDSNAQPHKQPITPNAMQTDEANKTKDIHLSRQINQTKPTATGNQPTLTIGVLGDSLSAGYGIKAEDGWVALLSQKLQQQSIKAKVINASVSGATTDAGLNMQAGLMTRLPNIVILELGANDGLQGKPLDLIEHNLRLLITRSQKAGAKVLILGVQLPPNLGKRYTQPFFALYAKLANEQNTALVPFFLEGVAGNSYYMQSDGLHPNAKAQPLILNNVWPSLNTLIKQVFHEKTLNTQRLPPL